MGVHTNIEWCDSTVNPTMGCDGCELWSPNNKTCYAGLMTQAHKLKRAGKIEAKALQGKHYDPWNGKDGWPHDFKEVMLFPDRMTDAAEWSDLRGRKRKKPSIKKTKSGKVKKGKMVKKWLDGLPRCIFVSDMGDSLSGVVTFEYLEKEIIREVSSESGQRHIWMWLTKQPQRMAEFSDWLKSKGISWPPNLWAMTSVTTQGTANKRIPSLLMVGDESTTRGLSVEPLWEEVTLATWLHELDWIIVGGESGPKRRVMNLDWAVKIQNECAASQIPFFFKQMGGPKFDKGGDLSDLPPKYACLNERKLPRKDRKEQIKGAGDTYRKKWPRVPIARDLADKLVTLAGKKKYVKTYLNQFLRKNLPQPKKESL